MLIGFDKRKGSDKISHEVCEHINTPHCSKTELSSTEDILNISIDLLLGLLFPRVETNVYRVFFSV